MLSLLRFEVAEPDAEGFRSEAVEVLRLLAARPGYVRGRLARAVDDPTRWVLASEWAGVGAYRRALSSYDVKVGGTALLSRAVDEPGGYESVDVVDGPVDGTEGPAG